jgi:hypothetical protein
MSTPIETQAPSAIGHSIMGIIHAGFSAKRKSFRDLVSEFRLHGLEVCQEKLNAEVSRRFSTKRAWNEHCQTQWDIKDAGASFRKAKSTYAYAVEHGLPIVDETNNVILTTNAVVEHKKASVLPAATPEPETAEETHEPALEAEASETPELMAHNAEAMLMALIESGHESLVIAIMDKVDGVLIAATGTDG